MSSLNLPWLELAVALPLLGSLLIAWLRDPNRARPIFVVFSVLSLVSILGGCIDYYSILNSEPTTPGGDYLRLFGKPFFVLDKLNAPLLALTALLFVLTAFSKSRASIRNFSFGWTLLSQSIMLATLACVSPWGIITFLALSTLPPLVELLRLNKPIGVYVTHMSAFILLLVLGWILIGEAIAPQPLPVWTLLPLVLALFIRSGIAPFHCWMTDLFEHTTFGTAMLYVVPMPAAYAFIRLLFPIAPGSLLSLVGLAALITALYASCMVLVQYEVRRFYCYLFLSFSALVLAGMDTREDIGLTGGLCIWQSVALALAGLGQTLRALESRHGRISLKSFHGLYDQHPALAACFLITGLASVGFPGTMGYLGTEMLMDSAVAAYPYVGVIVILVAALNGIAVMKAYFLLFTGSRPMSAVPSSIGMRERFAVLTLVVLILLGGLFPQFLIESRYEAAVGLLERRKESQPLEEVSFLLFNPLIAAEKQPGKGGKLHRPDGAKANQ